MTQISSLRLVKMRAVQFHSDYSGFFLANLSKNGTCGGERIV